MNSEKENACSKDELDKLTDRRFVLLLQQHMDRDIWQIWQWQCRRNPLCGKLADMRLQFEIPAISRALNVSQQKLYALEREMILRYHDAVWTARRQRDRFADVTPQLTAEKTNRPLYWCMLALYPTERKIVEYHFKLQLSTLASDACQPSVKAVLSSQRSINDTSAALGISCDKVKQVVYTFLGLIKDAQRSFHTSLK